LQLSNYSRFSPYKSEAAFHPKNTISPKEAFLRPGNSINPGAEDSFHDRHEESVEYDAYYADYFPTLQPLTPYPDPTEPVVGTSVFSCLAKWSFPTSYTKPLILFTFESEVTRRCRLWKYATSKPRNGSKLHGPDCFCPSCSERISFEGPIRTTTVPARRTRRNHAPPQNSLRAKHQKAPMRYTARNQTRFFASTEDDINALAPQPAIATAVFKRQVSLQPTITTRKGDHHWKQGWKTFFRHIKTKRRPNKYPREMRRSTYIAYCREIRRTHKVEYCLLASLIKLCSPPKARLHPNFAMDLEPVDEPDVGRNDDELSNP
jgi:hypothetical protein